MQAIRIAVGDHKERMEEEQRYYEAQQLAGGASIDGGSSSVQQIDIRAA